jgi:hypothetical protein
MAGWEDGKMEVRAPLEFHVDRIGDFTLIGMLAQKDEIGRWSLQDVTFRDITVYYNTCVLQPSALCRDVAWLYKHGAKQVALIEKASTRPMPLPRPTS